MRVGGDAFKRGACRGGCDDHRRLPCSDSGNRYVRFIRCQFEAQIVVYRVGRNPVTHHVAALFDAACRAIRCAARASRRWRRFGGSRNHTLMEQARMVTHGHSGKAASALEFGRFIDVHGVAREPAPLGGGMSLPSRTIALQIAQLRLPGRTRTGRATTPPSAREHVPAERARLPPWPVLDFPRMDPSSVGRPHQRSTKPVAAAISALALPADMACMGVVPPRLPLGMCRTATGHLKKSRPRCPEPGARCVGGQLWESAYGGASSSWMSWSLASRKTAIGRA